MTPGGAYCLKGTMYSTGTYCLIGHSVFYYAIVFAGYYYEVRVHEVIYKNNRFIGDCNNISLFMRGRVGYK